MAARKRLPRGFRRELPVRATAASFSGLARARAALVTSDPTVISDLEALAEREQWRVDEEAERNAQGCLRLRPVA